MISCVEFKLNRCRLLVEKSQCLSWKSDCFKFRWNISVANRYYTHTHSHTHTHIYTGVHVRILAYLFIKDLCVNGVCMNRMVNSTCSKFFIVLAWLWLWLLLLLRFCFTFFACARVCASSPGLSFPFFSPFELWFLWDFRLILKSFVSWFNGKESNCHATFYI